MHHRNLYHACIASYDVDHNDQFIHSEPWPWTKPPVAVVGGLGNINACLIGTVDRAVVVAFRGTLAGPSPKLHNFDVFLDWAQDFIARPTETIGFPGKVHTGLMHAFTTIWPRVAVEMERQLNEIGSGAELYMTGHSKGGTLANYAAWAASQMDTPHAPHCVTFGAPRPGDIEFQLFYNQAVRSVRYENRDDPVPHMPPSTKFIRAVSLIPAASPRVRRIMADASDWNYWSVGQLKYLRDDTVLTPQPEDYDQLTIERLSELISSIAVCELKRVAGDHALVNYAGLVPVEG